MALKLVLLFGICAVACAIEVQHTYQQNSILKAIPLAAVKQIDYEDGPAEYEFTYSVNDKSTGDIKSQKESRKGDKVEGSYELIDSDGHRRLVEYTADDHNGFQAIVHREPTDIKIPIPERKAPEPILHKIIASPLVHYTPVTKVLHQALPIHQHTIITAPAPVKLVQQISGNHVSYSGPNHSYNY